MATANPSTQLIFNQEENSYLCEGSWSVLQLDGILTQFYASQFPEVEKLNISGERLSYLDSAGALTILNCMKALKEKGKEVSLIQFTDEQMALVNLVEKSGQFLNYDPPPPAKKNFFARVGEESINKFQQLDGFVILLGDLSSKIFEAFGYWRRFHLASIVSNIYSAGIQALPIVGLLAFLIGIVLAYQMGLQLQTYGANIFIAYLSGLAIFREFGPLITAIIVAGRTSSAFTAQIGSMKINEEIDAIDTMGLSATELLVLPKVLALLLIFPLLIFWADVFSILGALFMSKWMLNVSYSDFMLRLRDAVGLDQLMLGLYKAPAFAILVSLVGCYQGFRVEADNIGSQTTKSVVQALFLIIVADAIYSIIYSWLNL
ncbi:MlaE family ABC transporter permease [Legionella jordanis]|uniref:ABC transporter permease n=1 Tax=Legionella jordanis TaxID=456 RepID=A0A0W0VBI5_9GAMM|nr:ABC transporter permease [Legionella jordanis]KTD17477.1 ABC transporter permease [Legionella jordanis]RMX05183.1 ABC transporter permease [Legionella jordanis]RMX17439.1 ABC transporter permease [Legionella jordanis]VEH13446.1 putative ABC transport system permease [Legionella jordanis]HAT8714365.1 MlaE family lipid ABC transporter permease subunit [Legionella jordanis]